MFIFILLLEIFKFRIRFCLILVIMRVVLNMRNLMDTLITRASAGILVTVSGTETQILLSGTTSLVLT